MASCDPGGLDPSESEPVLVEWHWYDDVPAYAGVARWALIGILLILVKANRNWQAWAILVPFVVFGEILAPWIARPFAVLFAESVRCELAFQWLVVAWTALWLVSPWLARCRPPAAFALALMFAAAIGFGEYFGIYQNHGIGQPLTSYMAWVLAISTAVALTAISCRKTYRPGRFLLRLALWLIVAAIGCVIGEHILGSLWLPGAGRRPNLMASMPNLILLSLCTAAVLYVFNLPYLCLAFCVGPYRDRFQKVLRLSADSWRATTPLAAPTASDALMAGATGQILTPSTPQSTPPS